jgi:hypothetical protein
MPPLSKGIAALMVSEKKHIVHRSASATPAPIHAPHPTSPSFNEGYSAKPGLLAVWRQHDEALVPCHRSQPVLFP